MTGIWACSGGGMVVEVVASRDTPVGKSRELVCPVCSKRLVVIHLTKE